MRPYIGIEGPIGVGKTTLATYLQNKLNAELMLEVFEENPFLAKFYDEPECYALQTQLFFLMSRYRQHEILGDDGSILVSDYIFAKNDLFARYTLSGQEHILYKQISSTLAARLAMPTLVVHLRADLDTLMQRIHKRGREYEQGESMRDYMEKLIDQYDTFFADYTTAPVLTLNTAHVNIVDDIEARQKLLTRIIDDLMPSWQTNRLKLRCYRFVALLSDLYELYSGNQIRQLRKAGDIHHDFVNTGFT